MYDPVLLYTIQLVAISSALLLAIGMLKANPSNLSARVFATGAFFVVLYFFEGMGQAHVDPTFRIDISPWPWRLLVHPAVQAVPGLFMVYCFLVFQEGNRFPIFLLVLFGLQILFEAIVLLPEGGIEITIPTQVRNSLDALQLTFVGLGIYWTFKGWSDDLVDDRRLLRWLTITILGFLVLFALIIENVFISGETIDTAQAQLLTQTVIATVLASVLIISVNFEYKSLFNWNRKVVGLSEAADQIDSAGLNAEYFDQVFVGKKLYRVSGLTISSLAKRLGQPEYRLRDFIKTELGHNNFNSMLHHYRITDACAQLVDPKNLNLSISVIATLIGYRSVTPFNKAFRERTGETPSEYRKRGLN